MDPCRRSNDDDAGETANGRKKIINLNDGIGTHKLVDLYTDTWQLIAIHIEIFSS